MSSSKLIVDQDSTECLTSRKECDCHTALTRGLREYLESIVFTGKYFGSQKTQMKRVEEDFADPEVSMEYPSAAVYTTEPGIFADDERFTCSLVTLSSGISLVQYPEFVQVITVDVHASSREQRLALCSVLEDAFDPRDWAGGFVLQLPHYFNARAEYQKLSVDYLDSAENVGSNWRIAQFQIEGRVPQYRVAGRLPKLRIRPRVSVEDTGGSV